MQREITQSIRAIQALELVTQLQTQFVAGLEQLGKILGLDTQFDPVEWLRDGGSHGGGVRFCAGEDALFNRASVNISQVHYDDDPTKKLGSATAISTIIHPQNPHAPSIHIHISWTEMRDGNGYWRMMADLNPSLENESNKQTFTQLLKEASGDTYAEGSAQGDRYFNIPALGRHRGVAHFYLEQYKTDSPETDFAFAQSFGEQVIDGYVDILTSSLKQAPVVTTQNKNDQLAYHTLYLFQVLTLDRGTTSGLMVHNQNDLGIMGSIPARVNKALLESWANKCDSPQDSLVRDLVAALPGGEISPITHPVKLNLAQAVKAHYKNHPEALAMQARGNVTPPTVDNHK
ncbi:MAG: coproporphyrinogen III oxidase [Rubritalea sp.]|uniref:coproporphyrinogen III oxidase n=1 Tax=Rubritalea sp. TaxID=2109375 RepID=UPI00324247E8